MQTPISITTYPVRPVLDILLSDKTTGRNIIWATDAYASRGSLYADRHEITVGALTGIEPIELMPRIAKSAGEQLFRTRKKAEVMTPVWLCARMNSYLDEDYLGRGDVFGKECDAEEPSGQQGSTDKPSAKEQSRQKSTDKPTDRSTDKLIDDSTTARQQSTVQLVEQNRQKPSPSWQDIYIPAKTVHLDDPLAYIDSRRLEITCGEAPYLASRYDTTTGQMIEPLSMRVGLLDRKLRVVDEYTLGIDEWIVYSIRALESIYGYEYQGDSLLIARANIYMTYIEYYVARWGEYPDDRLLKKIAGIVAWNIWQMDGLTDCVPLGVPTPVYEQVSLADILGDTTDSQKERALACRIRNHRSGRTIEYRQCKEKTMKMFDYVIGNPPYNEDFDQSGDNGKFAKPVYNDFMDASYKIADKVELIHPARFLFNAGSTPKPWNEKMLKDEHFKVLHYAPDSSIIFPTTDIKGGVAITYHDKTKKFGAIEIFSPYDELNTILQKVKPTIYGCMTDIISGRGVYKLSDVAIEEHPEIIDLQSKGHKKDVGSGAFKILKDIVFFEQRPDDDEEYVQFLGLVGGKRTYYYGVKRYQDTPNSFYKYKVFIPQANGSGAIGEVLTTPLIGAPLIGATETFLSIGSFDKKKEAENCLKYVKSKFARVMLGILKVTQANTKEKWKYVPLQDFTPASDIDWSRSIHEIDEQLYRKYGLSADEIEFIESHVKEMS